MRLGFLFPLLSMFAAYPAFAASPVLVDYNFGATEAVWKNDGSALALQDKNGIAIRDGQTLSLKRYFPLKSARERWFRLRAWSGDDLFLQSGEYFSNQEVVETAPATLLSAQTGKVKAVWKAVDFSVDGNTLWFHKGKTFRVLDLGKRRWFDARLPLRTDGKESDSWRANVTFSPDGRFVADQLADGEMRLWNVKSGKLTTTLSDGTKYAYPQAMAPVVWSPDGKLVATLGEDPSHFDIVFEEGPNDGTINAHSPVVKVWDAHSGKRVQWFQSVGSPNRLWWRDNSHLAIGGAAEYAGDAAFEVRRVGDDKGWQVKSISPVALYGARLFAGDRLFALGAKNQSRVLKVLFDSPTTLKNLAWSRDGRFIAASYFRYRPGRDDVNGVQIWNSNTFALENVGQAFSPMRVGWTKDNRAWSSNFYRITSWSERENWKSNEWTASTIGKPVFPDDAPAHGLFLLPDGTRILQLDTNFDGALYLRANRDAAPQLLFKNAQSGGSLSPDGQWLCFRGESQSNSEDYVLRAFETRLGGRYFEVKNSNFGKQDKQGNYRWEAMPHFSPDSQFVSWGFRVYAWPSLKVAADTFAIEGDTLALAPGGHKLLRLTSNDVRLIDLDGRALATISSDISEIKEAQFSPDGKRVSLARADKIEIYSATNARLLATLYAWPHEKPASGTDWLALRPTKNAIGTPTARALVAAPR